MRYYSCDLEATIQPDATWQTAAELETEVWLAAARNYRDADDYHLFYDMDDYMQWALNDGSKNLTFHNLKGYDSGFILDWLLRAGIPMVQQSDPEPYGTYVVGDKRGFSVFVHRGTLDFDVVNFLDTRTLVASSVADMGKTLGTTLKGDETPLVVHGDDLTDTVRRDGTLWTWEDAEAYIRADVDVVAETFEAMDLLRVWDGGIRTAASLAWACVKQGGDVRESLPDSTDDGELWAWAKAIGKDSNGEKQEVTGIPIMQAFKPTTTKGRTNDDVISIRGGRGRINGSQVTRGEKRKLTALLNNVIRGVYKGGHTYANPRTQDKVIGWGIILDINSMYPSIYSKSPLPQVAVGRLSKANMPKLPGYNECVTDSDRFQLIADVVRDKIDTAEYYGVVSITGLHATCHPDRLPIIKPSTNDPQFNDFKVVGDDGSVHLASDAYHYEIDYRAAEGVKDPELVLTAPELEYLVQNYTIHAGDIGNINYYAEGDELKQQFRDHAIRWTKEKIAAKKQNRMADYMFAKLVLNSAYGKLAEFTKEYPDHKFILHDGVVVDVRDVDDTTNGGRDDADIVTAAYITAWGRVYLAQTINKVGLDRFVYCDTDSMHIKWDFERDGDKDTLIEWLRSLGVRVDKTELGAWDLEARYSRARYVKPKHYGQMLVDWDGNEVGWKSVAAGFTEQINENEFGVGSVFTDKRAVAARGGVLLVDVDMQINPGWIDRLPPREHLPKPTDLARIQAVSGVDITREHNPDIVADVEVAQRHASTITPWLLPKNR